MKKLMGSVALASAGLLALAAPAAQARGSCGYAPPPCARGGGNVVIVVDNDRRPFRGYHRGYWGGHRGHGFRHGYHRGYRHGFHRGHHRGFHRGHRFHDRDARFSFRFDF